MDIRALEAHDDRSRFACGDAEMDRFLRSYAGQNQFKHHVGVTYVAIEGVQVLGFVTVAPGQIEIDRVPDADRRKLPRYPLPILRLARLAVDESAQGRGLGLQLLRFVLQLAVRMADEYGCVGVVVDAKKNAVSFYTKYGFVPIDVLEGGSDTRPEPTPMFLSTRAIRSSAGRAK